MSEPRPESTERDEGLPPPSTGTPETAAVTGTISPAAEPSPMVRARRPAVVGGIFVFLIAGLGLIACAVFGPDSSTTRAGTGVAGGIVIALGVIALAGVLPTRVVAMLGLVGGVALIVSGVLADVRQLPDWGRVAFGTTLLIAAAGSLAPSSDSDRGDGATDVHVDTL